MALKKKFAIEKPLTELELQIMNSVWDLGDCTVKDVQSSLAETRELAYTSVATMMKILEQKGFLETRKGDRAHTYRPVVSRADYESTSLKLLEQNVFRGNPSSMVQRLLTDSDLSEQELQKIRKVLDERLRK